MRVCMCVYVRAHSVCMCVLCVRACICAHVWVHVYMCATSKPKEDTYLQSDQNERKHSLGAKGVLASAMFNATKDYSMPHVEFEKN